MRARGILTSTPTDEAAGYGIAGLVAGGVGLAVAKKAGLLVLLLKFIKPILLGLVVLFGAFRGRIMRLFGRREEEVEWEENPPLQGEGDFPQHGGGAAQPPEIGEAPPPPLRGGPPPRSGED